MNEWMNEWMNEIRRRYLPPCRLQAHNYQHLMPNSNIYLTGLGATIFALIKQWQGSLLSSERAIASWSCKNDIRLLSNVCLPSLVELHHCRETEEDWGPSHPDDAPDFLPPQSPDADQLADRADERLFFSVGSVPNTNHVLHSRLPVKRPKIYDLIPRAHDYSSPKDEQNFITRLLYKNIL